VLSDEFARCTGKAHVLHLKKLVCTQENNTVLSIAAAVAGAFCRTKIPFFIVRPFWKMKACLEEVKWNISVSSSV